MAAVRSAAGASRRLVKLALDERYLLLASVPLLVAYEAVLTRPEHVNAAGLSVADVQALVDAVAIIARPVRLSYLWRPMLSDPRDDKVMETAVRSGTSFAMPVLRPADGLRRLTERP